jgi:fatty-acyl-CoA synthase
MGHSPFESPQQALAFWADRDPEREALVFPEANKRLSFGAWKQKSEAVARWLLDLGLPPNTPIAILAENRIEWPVVQIAAAMAHCIFVPLNTHYRLQDLSYAMKHSEAEAIFLSSSFRKNEYLAMIRELRAELPRLRHVVSFDERGGDVQHIEDVIAEGSRSRSALPVLDSSAIGSIQYTSGTTGFSKGTLLHHSGMIENAWQTMQRLNLGPSDRYTSIIPLFHCAGCIMGILNCLQAGAVYVGVPAFDPVKMFEVIEHESCTALTGVPTSYLAMLQHPDRAKFNMTTLRTGTCGGADCNPDILDACAKAFPIPDLVQVYGQTEASTLISMAACNDVIKVADAGLPLEGYEVRITDPVSGETLSVGKIGQIEARGDMLMIGYHKNPPATAETVGPDGWLRTGDLGSLSEDGRLTLAGGRLRDMIIRGGENIYPVEIENVLSSHPAVAEVAVFAIKDEYYGETVGAALRLKAPVASRELSNFCRTQIAGFKVPVHWFSVDAYPLTSSGKIRKVELREKAAEGKLDKII